MRSMRAKGTGVGSRPKSAIHARTRRRRLLLAACGSVALLLAMAVPMARSWYRSARIAEGRREGMARYEERRYEEAIPFLALAARDAEDLDVVIALADSRRRVPETDRRHLVTAAGYYRAALRQDGMRIDAWRGLLECAIELGYVAEIPEIAARILAQEPGDRRAREAILETRVAQARWDEAAAAARDLQALEPEEIRWRAAELRCLRADGADALGRLELLRGWRSTRPEDDGLALLESDLLRELGRDREAREILERLVRRGVPDIAVLEAMLESLDAMGLESLADEAVTLARRSVGSPREAARIEARRHLRAGRLALVGAALFTSDGPDASASDEDLRLALTAAYLRGEADEARRIAAFLRGDDAELLQTALSDAALRARLDAITDALGPRPADPLCAAMLADLLLAAGELEEAHGVVLGAYEATGRRFQPLGIRAARGAVILGRHPEALTTCRALALRAPDDPSVALVMLEAWSGALAAGYEDELPRSRLSLAPEATLENFWNAMGAPVALAPEVARALAVRGRADAASGILEALVDGSLPMESELEKAILRGLAVADDFAPELVDPLERRLAGSQVGVGTATVLAGRLADRGRRAEALSLLERTAAGTALDGSDRAVLERWRGLLSGDGAQGTAALRAGLERDASLEGAAFVLARQSAWSDEPLVIAAIAAMRASLGEGSLRAAVADAVRVLVFHAEDRARIASAIASLDAALRRAPDSVSVLTTLARLLRAADPPDDAGAAELLVRAIELQPADLELYPELVAALQETGDYEAAERAIERYIRLAGADIGANRRAARMQERQGRLVEAAMLHEQIAGRTRESIDRLALARIRQRLGRTAEAREILVDLIGESVDPLVVRELALVEARESGIVAARAILGEHGARLPESRRLAISADLEMQFGDLARALDDARRLTEIDDSATSHRQRCRIALRLGRSEEARAALAIALARAPRDPEVLPLAGALLMSDPESRAVLRGILAEVERGRPDLLAAVEFLERAADASGTVETSVANIAAARELTLRHSSSPVVWRILVELLRGDRDASDAAIAARTALSRLPNDASIARLATETAFEAGMFDEAAAAASVWRRQGGSEILDADAALALIALARGDRARAAAELAPHAGELVRRPRSLAALRALVLSRVLAGEAARLADELRGARPEDGGRFGSGDGAEPMLSTVVAAWLEAVQALADEAAAGALEALDGLAGDDARVRPAIVAQATVLCRNGGSRSCELARARLAEIDPSEPVVPLLRADLAAATHADDAIGNFATLYQPALARTGLARGELAAILDPLRPTPAGRAAELRALLAGDPVAVAAIHNEAEHRLAKGVGLEVALELSAIAAGALPASDELLETHARCLAANGRGADAIRLLGDRPASLALAVTRAEVLAALGRSDEARLAVARAFTIASRSVAVPHRLRERIESVEEGGAGRRTVGWAEPVIPSEGGRE